MCGLSRFILVQESLPAESMTGNIEITLDSGQQYRVDEMKMYSESDALREMLLQVRPRARAPAPSAMVLPGVSDKQFHVLMHALYASDAATWAQHQSASDLWELAEVSHMLGCANVLALAGKALMRQSPRILFPSSAVGLCQRAQRLGRIGMQHEAAIAIMSSLPQLSTEDLAAAAELLPPLVSGARAEVVNALLDIESCNYWCYPHASQSDMLRRAKALKIDLQARIAPDAT